MSRGPGTAQLGRDAADDTAPSTNLFFLFTYRAKVIKICVARIVGMDLKFYIALRLAPSFAFNWEKFRVGEELLRGLLN